MATLRPSLAAKLEVGSRVATGVAGKKGEIKFIGDTQFSTGEWVGIALDTPEGKNDGSVAGVRYFECKQNHGLFLKRAQVRLDTSAASTAESKDRLAALREKRRVSTIPATASKLPPTRATSKLSAPTKLTSAAKDTTATAEPNVGKAVEPVETDTDAVEDAVEESSAAEAEADDASYAVVAGEDNSDEGKPSAESVVSAISAHPEVNTLHEEIDRLNNQVTELTAARNDDQTMLKAKESELHDTLKAKESQLQDVVKAKESELQDIFLTKESQLQSQIDTLNHEAQELRNERDKAAKRLTETLSSTGSNNATLTATLDELRELRERTDQELSKLRSELSAERDEVATTKKRLDTANKEVESDRSSLVHLRGEIEKADSEASVQKNNATKLRAELDKTIHDLSVEKSSAAKVRSDFDRVSEELKSHKKGREEAERECEKLRALNTGTSSQTAKAAAEAEAAANRIKELEDQMNDLMETCEMMTLDKEQLILDNELLQAQLDEANITTTAPASTTSTASTEGQSEENAKLREALRRLHQQASVDKTKLDELIAEKLKHDKELETLRAYRSRTEDELLELHQQVDESASFESLIESLTDKNLELTQRASQLELTVSDLEEQQELSEELDQRQRHELEINRKQLDSANILVQEKEKTISQLEAKIEEGKRVNEKFRRTCEQLKAELDEMRGKISLSAAESQRAQERARAAASSQASFEEVQDQLQSLTHKLRVTQEAKNQLKVLYSRQSTIFGSCSLYATEINAVKHEIAVVSAAAAGSALCRAALNRCMERLRPVQQSVRDTSSDSDSPNDSSATPGALPSDSISAAAISQVLQLLKVTCIAWQCSAAVLSSTSSAVEGVVDISSIASSASNLHSLFERVMASAGEFLSGSSLDGVVVGEDVRLGFDASLSAELDKVSAELEGYLSAHFKLLGVRSLGLADLQHNDDRLELSDALVSLKKFYLACQSSYFASGADLVAAFVISKSSSSSTSSTSSSSSSSTAAAAAAAGDNSAVVADLSRTLRLELEGLSVLSGGETVTVTSTALEAAYVRDILGSCFISLDSKNLLLGSSTSGTTTATAPLVSPTQLRSSLAYLSQLRSSMVAHGAEPSSSDRRHAEAVRVVNITDNNEVQSLWSLLLSADSFAGVLPAVSREVQAAVVPEYWQRFSVWDSRTRDLRGRLTAWEASYSEIGSLKEALESLQGELKFRQEELRAAKAANQELSSIAASAGALNKTAAATKGSSSAVSSEESEKLKGEIKVLTTALSVLEVQFENAEKENKRLRASNRSGAGVSASASSVSLTEASSSSSGSGNPAAVTALVKLLRIWRGVALHRLTSSLKPLPFVQSLGSNAPVVVADLSNKDQGKTASGSLSPFSAAAPAMDISAQSQSAALSTYREIRKMRASIRIYAKPDTEGKTPTSTSVLLGKSLSRRKDATLLEKYRNSLLACAASLG